ncbi:hypothetical protein K7X08_024160 [Anisodus acutangulus]|uniref:Uncharacterized protein n=1 Tax=Anisodus acutangulus TaxID=402998 RepID=A0A9Q1M9G7_9SOLA|nr:hypothetical protein K7X08_024160 [Anisodus acutangulus]
MLWWLSNRWTISSQASPLPSMANFQCGSEVQGEGPIVASNYHNEKPLKEKAYKKETSSLLTLQFGNFGYYCLWRRRNPKEISWAQTGADYIVESMADRNTSQSSTLFQTLAVPQISLLPGQGYCTIHMN